MGPTTVTVVHEVGLGTLMHTRSCVGFSPTSPHSAAGMRIEPPPSVPARAPAGRPATLVSDPQRSGRGQRFYPYLGWPGRRSTCTRAHLLQRRPRLRPRPPRCRSWSRRCGASRRGGCAACRARY